LEKFLPTVVYTSDVATEMGREQQVDVSMTQHALVCALGELGSLVESLNTSASPLVSEPSTGELATVFPCIFP